MKLNSTDMFTLRQAVTDSSLGILKLSIGVLGTGVTVVVSGETVVVV